MADTDTERVMRNHIRDLSNPDEFELMWNENDCCIVDSEKFIDDKYEEIKYEKLKSELFADLNESLKDIIKMEIRKLRRGYTPLDDESNISTQRSYIKSLEDQIKFLKEEVSSKNNIIDLFIQKSLMHDERSSSSQDTCINFLHHKQLPQNSQNNYTESLSSNHTDNEHFKDLQNDSIKSDGCIETNIENQLQSIRKKKHEEFNAMQEITVKSRKQRLQQLAGYKIESRPSHLNTSIESDTEKVDCDNDVTYILGDSIIKDVKGWKLGNQFNDKTKVIVKPFSGAKIDAMNHHVIPSLNQKPNRVILHVGTNDIPSKKTHHQICNDILSLALKMSDKTNVIISGIIEREDRYNVKVKAVNELLKSKCQERNICFITHTISPKLHLNRSNLHLNRKGTLLLSQKFVDTLKKYQNE